MGKSRDGFIFVEKVSLFGGEMGSQRTGKVVGVCLYVKGGYTTLLKSIFHNETPSPLPLISARGPLRGRKKKTA